MSPDQNIQNPLSVMQPNEQVMCEIHRHPFGLFSIYFSSGLLVLVTLVIAIGAPFVVTNLNGQIRALLIIIFLFVTLFVAGMIYVSTKIYKNNRWVLSTDSLTQISQQGLLRKQVSQLSLANLEDVTASQNGIMQSFFHFGTLRCETAGEKSKFVFAYCPDPNNYARQILMARENYLRNDPNAAKRANDKLNLPLSQPPSSPVPESTNVVTPPPKPPYQGNQSTG